MATRGMTEWVHGGNTYKLNDENIAPEFSTATTYYAFKDWVYRNGQLYRFIKNHAAGDWNSADVEAIQLEDDTFKFQGYVGELGYTALTSCLQSGWYCMNTADYANITDLPQSFDQDGGSTMVVYNPSLGKNSAYNYITQIFTNNIGKSWWRSVRSTGVIRTDWQSQDEGQAAIDFAGKKVAIIGASNDTNGNPGDGGYTNVPEIEITEADVGVQLNAWLTYYDVQAGLSLGGHTYTSSEIGTKVTFTPTAADVGKVIGLPYNYNPSSAKVWWEIAADELGFIPIPVCWSGASITSHEDDDPEKKGSYAWHQSQIRKCGIRTPGTMTRTAPDIIIIARSLNDYGHTPYDTITSGYFDNINFTYPSTDQIGTNEYGFLEGLALTVKKLREAYPKAQIVMCTMKMAMRPAGGFDTFPPKNGKNTILQYSKAIRDAADFFGCKVIEFDKCGITYENFVDNYCVDPTSSHPSHANASGHKLLGHRAIKDLSEMNF